jgi:uncharacterized LabA/DUF88 family protein
MEAWSMTAMTDRSFCRIGVFYDGSYCAYAQRYFYHNRKLGWLQLRAFHSLLEAYVRTKEQGFANYRIVYAAWFQGLFPASPGNEQYLKNDRHMHLDLMHAGIEPKFLPVSQTSHSEKGVDVALAIDALQVGLEGKVDIAVLVSGDGDLIPLVRALMKNGVRVLAAYFQYEDGEFKQFINERLLAVCNYELNINQLETDKDFKAAFRSLFWRQEASGRPNNSRCDPHGEHALAAIGRPESSVVAERPRE